MASIERVVVGRDAAGARRPAVHYKVRYRDHAGREHSETKRRLVDAQRRKAEIETELARGTWLDPRRGKIRLDAWANAWIPTRHDLRATTHARLVTTMNRQVLPKFGAVPLDRITNADIRGWVAELMDAGLSAATVRKAVFALRQCLDAAIADNRLVVNPALRVPLPSERAKTPRFLSQREIERLVDEVPERYKALILVGAYAGLRWGEAAGLTRSAVDVGRSRISVSTTAVEVHGKVTLGHEPKTARSKRSIPVARGVMARIDDHLRSYVDQDPDALVFEAPGGGPLFRVFGQRILSPAARHAGLDAITYHGLRHTFVAVLVAAGCNVREVSEWAGHNSVAFTLTRYGGLFEDGTDDAVKRLDELLAVRLDPGDDGPDSDPTQS